MQARIYRMDKEQGWTIAQGIIFNIYDKPYGKEYKKELNMHN